MAVMVWSATHCNTLQHTGDCGGHGSNGVERNAFVHDFVVFQRHLQMVIRTQLRARETHGPENRGRRAPVQT